MKNADAQKKIQHLLDVREEERETELKELQEQQEKKHMLENLKLSPQSQAVFHIGAEAHEVVFSSWTVSTGCYLSGYSKGEPRIPERLHSMCLLTERPKGCSETERRIVGAFMVEDDFIGTCCTDGTIQAHPAHRIQLPPERQPLFWPYVVKEPEKQRWGKTAFKYMSNLTGEKILFDCKGNALTADEKLRTERFTGTTASSTACRHGSTWKPRSQPTAEQFSPVGQTRFLRMWARPSCSKPEPPVSFGFLRP